MKTKILIIVNIVLLILNCTKTDKIKPMIQNPVAPIILSTDATLSSLIISPGTLNPAFSSDTTNYSVNVEHSINQITITAVASHSNAMINGVDTDTYDSEKYLTVGDNKIIITVTSEDEMTIKIYTITINRSVLVFQSSMIPVMAAIPAITGFPMGSPPSEGGQSDEQPVHLINLISFFMSKYEITYKQYVDFLNTGGNDDHYNSRMALAAEFGIYRLVGISDFRVRAGKENHPIDYVLWDDAVAYCEWLSAETGQTYRLPTEAEWEYGAVGIGGHIVYPWGDIWDAAKCNTGWDTLPVGSFEDGKSYFGIYDMAGNVLEWCSDWYDSGYYSISGVNNPSGPISGTEKVIRGADYRNSNRFYKAPNDLANPNLHDIGFRIVRE